MLSMAKAKQYTDDLDLDTLVDEAAEAVQAQIPPVAAQDALNERMVAAIEKLAERQDQGPQQQIPIHKVPVKTPWNPTGTKNRPKLARPTFINGRKIGELWHTAEEIEKLNQIKPGHYWNRRIVVWSADTSGGFSSINLQFPNKSPDDKYEIMRLTAGKGLVGILDVILGEQNSVVLAR
jgi:hypothetical protein